MVLMISSTRQQTAKRRSGIDCVNVVYDTVIMLFSFMWFRPRLLIFKSMWPRRQKVADPCNTVSLDTWPFEALWCKMSSSVVFFFNSPQNNYCRVNDKIGNNGFTIPRKSQSSFRKPCVCIKNPNNSRGRWTTLTFSRRLHSSR